MLRAMSGKSKIKELKDNVVSSQKAKNSKNSIKNSLVYQSPLIANRLISRVNKSILSDKNPKKIESFAINNNINKPTIIPKKKEEKTDFIKKNKSLTKYLHKHKNSQFKELTLSKKNDKPKKEKIPIPKLDSNLDFLDNLLKKSSSTENKNVSNTESFRIRNKVRFGNFNSKKYRFSKLFRKNFWKKFKKFKNLLFQKKSNFKKAKKLTKNLKNFDHFKTVSSEDLRLFKNDQLETRSLVDEHQELKKSETSLAKLNKTFSVSSNTEHRLINESTLDENDVRKIDLKCHLVGQCEENSLLEVENIPNIIMKLSKASLKSLNQFPLISKIDINENEILINTIDFSTQSDPIPLQSNVYEDQLVNEQNITNQDLSIENEHDELLGSISSDVKIVNNETFLEINLSKDEIFKSEINSVKDIKSNISTLTCPINSISVDSVSKALSRKNNSLVLSLSEPNLNIIKSKLEYSASKSIYQFKAESVSSVNRNNNRSSYFESMSSSINKKDIILKSEESLQVVRNSTSENNSKNVELKKLENCFNQNMNRMYESHQEILCKYLNINKNKMEAKIESKKSEVFVLLPSLYDKYGTQLVNLFSNKIDDATFLPSYIDPRLIGEILYQLEQRVFSFIYRITPLNRRDISDGFEPLDILTTINNLSMDHKKDKININKFNGYMNRYKYLMKSFKEVGYKEDIHSNVSAFLIMKYGLYPCLPVDFQIHHQNYSQFELLFKILIKNLEENEKDFLIVLYLCLLLMAFDDQEPLFRYE